MAKMKSRKAFVLRSVLLTEALLCARAGFVLQSAAPDGAARLSTEGFQRRDAAADLVAAQYPAPPGAPHGNCCQKKTNIKFRQRRIFGIALCSQVVDAEFERVSDSEDREKERGGDAGGVEAKASPDGKSNSAASKDHGSNKSLLDLSLEADTDLSSTRIPFVYGDSYIDAKLAFLAELDGETYGIAIPYDHAVAITVEKPDEAGGGSVSYLSPDDDDNVELMEIMATQLREHLGDVTEDGDGVGADELRLKRTPRILTVSGPLEKYTGNWREDLAPKALDVESLLDDSDEDLDFFHKFMKEELGEEEYEKTIKESTVEGISPELLELFNIPGLGDQEDDIEGMMEMFESTLASPEEQIAKMPREFVEPPDHDGVALKLISFIFAKDGKSYSLVMPLKPYVLIGRCTRNGRRRGTGNNDDGEDDGVKFELLSPSEEKLLIPRLEQVCQKDLEQAGLKLNSNSNN